jgi:hypothetical protein
MFWDVMLQCWEVVTSILKQGVAFIFKGQRSMNSADEAEYHTFI